MPMPAWNLTRRELLQRTGLGLGGLALRCLLADEASAGGGAASPTRARRLIHVFLEGGPSHVDTFDPKPALRTYHGQVVTPPGGERPGRAFGSPFAFHRHGQSGLPLSELFPLLGRHADDLCVVRSLHTDDPGHEPAVLMMNTGNGRLSRPSVGAWLTYGLGTENQNLPGFVVLYQDALPLQGPQNWQAGFLPGLHQGVAVNTRYRQVDELLEHIRSPHASDAEQRLQLELLGALNQRHRQARPDDARLESRARAFELAYRMQAEATDAFDVAREPQRVQQLYGDSSIGRQCLLARRLVERGVRFVQLYHDGWDHHENLAAGLRDQARPADQAIAALLTDLKQRGLLEDTLVVCGGEFGRTPTADTNPSATGTRQPGRDHNHRGFSVLLAGGGVRGGLAYGATDDLGFAASADPVHVHDLHATLLHLLGLDHERLTYRHAGRDFRLTDVHGRVVPGLLA